MMVKSVRNMQLLGLIVLAVLWEVLPRAGLISPLFIPSLSSTVAAGLADWATYWEALKVTAHELAITLVFSCLGGVAAGMFVNAVPVLQRRLLPLLTSLYAVPIVILYPLIVVWVGIGYESKIVLGTFYGFFPAVLATASGLAAVPKKLLMAAESMGATKFQRAVYVTLPASIPVVLAGVRLGASLSIVGVVVAEMFTSAAGIGFLITNYRALLDTPHVFFAIILVAALAFSVDAFIGQLERRTAAWKPSDNTREETAPNQASLTPV